VYDKINDEVYTTGLATTQEAYHASLYPFFETLDRVEERLGQARSPAVSVGGEHHRGGYPAVHDNYSLRCGILN
jgi:glutathionyl-hydroquinone reductase